MGEDTVGLVIASGTGFDMKLVWPNIRGALLLQRHREQLLVNALAEVLRLLSQDCKLYRSSSSYGYCY